MSSVDGKTEKLVEYIEETRTLQIPVLPPDLNTSEVKFAVAGESIRFGFGAISGLTGASVDGIIAERAANGPYASVFDLVTRTAKRAVQKKTVESLIMVGACDTLPGYRTQQLEVLDFAFERAKLDVRDAEMGQIHLFGTIDAGPKEPALPKLPDATKNEKLRWEREGLGIYVSGHPADVASDLLRAAHAQTVLATLKTEGDRNVRVGGMVGPVRRFLTKAGKMMLTTSIEDRTGSLRIVLFPRQYEELQGSFIEGSIVAVSGSVKAEERTNDDGAASLDVSLLVDNVQEIASIGWEPKAEPTDDAMALSA